MIPGNLASIYWNTDAFGIVNLIYDPGGQVTKPIKVVKYLVNYCMSFKQKES